VTAGAPLDDVVQESADLGTAVVRWWSALATACLGGPDARAPALGPQLVVSETFHSPEPGAALVLAGPLVNLHGDAFPANVVALRPDRLAAGKDAFQLEVDARSRRAGTYVGTVRASAQGRADAWVRVWITIA
jgi:hypothetical protein